MQMLIKSQSERINFPNSSFLDVSKDKAKADGKVLVSNNGNELNLSSEA